MKANLYFSAIAIGIIAISSCKKFDSTNVIQDSTLKNTHGQDTDVYVAGEVYAVNGKSVAAYWKNGVLHKLSDSTTNVVGAAIAVVDTNVYVSGTITNPDGSLTAAYWVNGHKVILDNNAGVGVGEGIVVTACRCDVYVVGTVIEGETSKAVYWKNGVQHRLAGGTKLMDGNGIAVHGKDVYVTGLGVNSSNSGYAFYFKNDSLVLLTDTTKVSGSGNAIIVRSNDVYVAGSSWVNGQHYATVWKNGIPTVLANPLTDPGSAATGLAVNGSGTYTAVIAGTDASYWTNTTKTELTNSPLLGGVYDVVLSGNDVYVSGWSTSNGSSANPIASYWKNGVLTTLPTPLNGVGLLGGVGFSIAVVPHAH